MPKKIFLPCLFLFLFFAGACAIMEEQQSNSAESKAKAILRAQQSVAPRATGSFPERWIHGADEANDPRSQIHAYNDDTYIIRQSKFETFEAPFLFLIFGQERVLLLDTGANRDTPVAEPVEAIIREWLARNGRESIDLIVQHTHGHRDHVQGDSQFEGAPFVTEVVSTRQKAYEASWGFTDYPLDTPTIDLGGRVLDVLGTPGHHPASVTLYDRETQLLLTGDIVYAGHLFVFSPNSWPKFVASIERLVEWAAEHPIHAVVGCHIESNSEPFQHFAWGTRVHPNEHVLELAPTVLTTIFAACIELGDDPEYTTGAEFVIHPVYKRPIRYNE